MTPEHVEPTADPARSAADPTPVDSTRFVWPPRRPTEPIAPQPVVRRRRPAPRVEPDPRAPNLLEAIEREWLDVTTEPVARLIARGVWAPDAPGGYCHRCARDVGPHEVDEAGCARCRGTRPPWARIVRLGEHDGALRAMIAEVKFTRFRRLGADLGGLLAAAVVSELRRTDADVLAEATGRVVVVPVPTTTRRRLARGIDHTVVIARATAAALDARFVRALRRRHVPSQLTVAPSRRAANLAGTIRLRRGARARLAGRLVIVVDDVCTTGATMRAACRAIREGFRDGDGASLPLLVPPVIWAAVLARAQDPH